VRKAEGGSFYFLRAPSLAEGGSGSLTSLQSSCEALEVWKRVDCRLWPHRFPSEKSLDTLSRRCTGAVVCRKDSRGRREQTTQARLCLIPVCGVVASDSTSTLVDSLSVREVIGDRLERSHSAGAFITGRVNELVVPWSVTMGRGCFRRKSIWFDEGSSRTLGRSGVDCVPLGQSNQVAG
jgi:hypothetical protein